jgi:phosphatidylserine/phosphatidylglycerophosphate/cardiolipin synthase-like enzyme
MALPRREVQAESDLKNLARTYKNLRLTRLGDTHAKALVSDSAYAVVTSFNWLSFRGDPNRTFRDERGVMILIPLLVDAQFDAIVRRMDEAESRPTQQAAPAAQKKIGGTKSPRR